MARPAAPHLWVIHMNSWRLALVLTVTFVMIHTCHTFSAAQPGISGSWILDDAAAAADGPRRPFCGRTCEISQTPSTITVSTRGRTTTYVLDGKRRRTDGTGSGSKIESSSSAKLDGETIVIVTTVGDLPETTLRIRLIDGKLAVETSDSDFSGSRVKLRTLYRRDPRTAD